jgi:type II secretory pathway pseudopilin PulG
MKPANQTKGMELCSDALRGGSSPEPVCGFFVLLRRGFFFMLRAKTMRLKRRKGVTIVECVILMVVLGISMWAILSTAVWSAELRAFAKEEINARILASSWFEVFESVDPEPQPPLPPFDMNDTAAYVAKVLDPNASGNPLSGFAIQGYRVLAEETANTEGVRSVRLTLRWGRGSKRENPYVLVRRINARSSETVSDDRVGG